MNSLNPITLKNLQIEKATVTTAARLHMGFVDLSASQERMFGSLGLALSAPLTKLTIFESKKTLIVAKNHEYVAKVVENLKNALKIKANLTVEVDENIPEHAGLGSGTQMALAIAAGMSALFNFNLNTAQLAAMTSRGNRSGIGIGTFEQGGLVLDGGRRVQQKKIQPDSSPENDSEKYNLQEHNLQTHNLRVPPIIARHEFPQQWPILLIMDDEDHGVFGDAELQAFDTLKHADFATAQALSYRVLMQALPAVVEQDYVQFSHAIHALQVATGNYFSAAQGGHYKSLHVAQVLQYLNQQGIICAGQSSWGPTGFAIFENEMIANTMLNQLQQRFSYSHQLRFQLMRAKNTGASIQLN
ncbi:MAG: beta-ribofuranosylaminobenzene 5'-phosphate synthase family protein [Pseudomonadota bacterium]